MVGLPLFWSCELAGSTLTGRGDRELLAKNSTAFFASRQCPGVAIRAAMDWTLVQAGARNVVISGFHSPLEQSVLTVLLQARSPVMVVLARPVGDAKLPSEWAEPLAQGRMAVVSSAVTAGRLTEERAAGRNHVVAQLASQIVVAHASPGGRLAALCDQWHEQGRTVFGLLDA